jgi:polyisoprenoid-binding protein YceI
MKIARTTILFALAVGLISCGGEKKPKKTEPTIETVEAAEMSYTVSAEKSSINWEGTMMGMYSHSGDIKLQSGNLSVKDGMITAGEFVIDMKSINPTDENFSEENPREGLIGHLGTGDFFASDSLPTASFKITSAEGTTATGDLTIKGITKPGTITDISVEETDGMVMASGNLVFDRQEFGVAFKMTGDKVLSDDITLAISLTGKTN